MRVGGVFAGSGYHVLGGSASGRSASWGRHPGGVGPGCWGFRCAVSTHF